MFYGRKFIAKPTLDDYKDSAEHFPGTSKPEPMLSDSREANLVTSCTGDIKTAPHYPVIDIDVPINLVPASRIGHTHLYINHPVSQEGLMEILEVLTKHGIVEQGYLSACKARGYSAVRLPWIKKRQDVR